MQQLIDGCKRNSPKKPQEFKFLPKKCVWLKRRKFNCFKLSMQLSALAWLWSSCFSVPPFPYIYIEAEQWTLLKVYILNQIRLFGHWRKWAFKPSFFAPKVSYCTTILKGWNKKRELNCFSFNIFLHFYSLSCAEKCTLDSFGNWQAIANISLLSPGFCFFLTKISAGSICTWKPNIFYINLELFKLSWDANCSQ